MNSSADRNSGPIQTLHDAAQTALAAPSVFNTQPWAWTVFPDRLELRADRSRQLVKVDPDGRLLAISCGAAAHHALVAVTDYRTEVTLTPDGDDADLLAVIRLTTDTAERRNLGLRQAIGARRTDRRPFQKAPVSGAIIDRLLNACRRHGAHMYLVPWQHMPALALAAVGAGALQLSDPDYRMELSAWTHRPPWSADGVPVETAVQSSPRRVPVRDFAPFGESEAMPAGLDNDFGSSYAIIYTDTDDLKGWCQAGMGLSAVLLTATTAGLGTATISDVTEMPVIREQLRTLLPSGYPQVAVRIGHPQPGLPPATPRRAATDVIMVAAH